MSRTGYRPLSLEQLHQRTDVRFYVDSAVHRRDASTKLDKFFDSIQVSLISPWRLAKALIFAAQYVVIRQPRLQLSRG